MEFLHLRTTWVRKNLGSSSPFYLRRFVAVARYASVDLMFLRNSE